MTVPSTARASSPHSDPGTASNRPDLTILFARLRDGEDKVLGDIVDALYTELHSLAARRMRDETRRHTLQPTALVHEAYLRLMGSSIVINDRHHFFALAARAMRRVLVDHARHRRAGKRGGGLDRVTLELIPGLGPVDVDVIALDEALSAFSELDPRAARVVELRFFGGHTDKEVSAILGEKIPTVRRDWSFARRWLRTHLTPAARA
jgi:RNA polymerase sigma factor (TIGR02999 family)